MNALEKLKSVLCSPDGEVCIHGSDGDRRIVADALADLESAPVAQNVPDVMSMIPPEITLDNGLDYSLGYKRGWNDCRRETLAAAQAQEEVP